MQSLSCHILCVDDDTDTCEILTLLLAQYGLEVMAAPSVSEALRLAASAQFDLYILDAWLPDGTGVELCRRLRAMAPDAVIIFYSGLAYESDQAQGLRAGAQAYVAKPAFDQLIGTVQRLLPTCAEATA